MASNDWKSKNYNKSIKVSKADVQSLRAGGSFTANVAKFKSGATAGQREAMNRFYGKARVDAALGSAVSSVNKSYPSTTGKNSPGSSYRGAGAISKKSSGAGNGMRGTINEGRKNIGNIASVKSDAAGTAFGNQISAAKKYKAPSSYKPLSTGTKVGMAASAIPAGKLAVLGGKVLGRVVAGKKVASSAKAITAGPRPLPAAPQRLAIEGPKVAPKAAPKVKDSNAVRKATSSKISTTPTKATSKPRAPKPAPKPVAPKSAAKPKVSTKKPVSKAPVAPKATPKPKKKVVRNG